MIYNIPCISPDDLTCGTSRDAWCAPPAPEQIPEPRTIRSMSESEHNFYSKTSVSDPDLSAGMCIRPWHVFVIQYNSFGGL